MFTNDLIHHLIFSLIHFYVIFSYRSFFPYAHLLTSTCQAQTFLLFSLSTFLVHRSLS